MLKNAEIGDINDTSYHFKVYRYMQVGKVMKKNQVMKCRELKIGQTGKCIKEAITEGRK